MEISTCISHSVHQTDVTFIKTLVMLQEVHCQSIGAPMVCHEQACTWTPQDSKMQQRKNMVEVIRNPSLNILLFRQVKIQIHSCVICRFTSHMDLSCMICLLARDEIKWCTYEDWNCPAEITSDDWPCFQRGSYSSSCCQLSCAFLLCVLVYYFPRTRRRIACCPFN